MSKPKQTRKDKEEDKAEQGTEDHCVDVEKDYINKSQRLPTLQLQS